MRSQTPPHTPRWPQGTHHSSMAHAYTPMKPYFVISGHFGAKMRILSSKSHISTKKLMRTKIFFKKNNPEPPGGPQGSLRRSLTHMHTPATAHQRPFSVIFALKAAFYAAKADFRCSKWPYKVILKPYGQISHTYTIQDIQTACLNLFLKRFEDFSKLKMRQIDQKWVTQSQTGP